MKLFVIGNEKNPLEANLTEFEGRRVFDLRQWYTDSNSGKLLPTKKGLTLSKDKFYQVMSELSENSDRIKEWFAFNGNKKNVEAHDEAVVSTGLNGLICEIKSMGASQLFELEVLGAESCLSINLDSPLGNFFLENVGSNKFHLSSINDATVRFFITFLVSFAKAQHRICSDESLKSPVDFVEDIELECKRVLINELKKK